METKEAQLRLLEDIERQTTQLAKLAEAERRMRTRIQQHNNRGANLTGVIKALKQPGMRSLKNGSGRPSSPIDGAVSFHFSITTQSKARTILAALIGKHKKGGAASHQEYTERDNAAEVLPENKIIKDNANELSSDSQEYIERDGATEHSSGELSSFGNIGKTKDDRIAFWESLEEIERQPRTNTVNIDPQKSPEFWLKIYQLQQKNKPIPEPILRAFKTQTTVSLKLNPEKTLDLLRFVQSMGMLSDAVTCLPGRGARVQTRIVAELPHELTSKERLEIAKAYCKKFEDEGHPYWAVIHAPDKNNDSRNFHLHINLSERPAKLIKNPVTGKDVWDFTVLEEFVTPRRQKRTRRPFMQARNRAMSERGWIKSERTRFCEISNQILSKSGVQKKYDPRTYKNMGIKQTPQKRISPSAYTQERRGEPTKEGLQQARQEWKDEADRLLYKHELAKQSALRHLNELTNISNNMSKTNYSRSFKIKQLKKEWEKKSDYLLSAISSRDASRYTTDKMVSRTKLVPILNLSIAQKLINKTAKEIKKDEEISFENEIIKARIDLDKINSEIKKEISEFKKHIILEKYAEKTNEYARHQFTKNAKIKSIHESAILADIQKDAKDNNPQTIDTASNKKIIVEVKKNKSINKSPHASVDISQNTPIQERRTLTIPTQPEKTTSNKNSIPSDKSNSFKKGVIKNNLAQNNHLDLASKEKTQNLKENTPQSSNIKANEKQGEIEKRKKRRRSIIAAQKAKNKGHGR